MKDKCWKWSWLFEQSDSFRGKIHIWWTEEENHSNYKCILAWRRDSEWRSNKSDSVTNMKPSANNLQSWESGCRLLNCPFQPQWLSVQEFNVPYEEIYNKYWLIRRNSKGVSSTVWRNKNVYCMLFCSFVNTVSFSWREWDLWN